MMHEWDRCAWQEFDRARNEEANGAAGQMRVLVGRFVAPRPGNKAGQVIRHRCRPSALQEGNEGHALPASNAWQQFLDGRLEMIGRLPRTRRRLVDVELEHEKQGLVGRRAVRQKELY